MGLLVNGAFMVGSTTFTQLPWHNSNTFVTMFWIVLGFVQVILGFQAARQFDQF
jgi:hypothetical protein